MMKNILLFLLYTQIHAYISIPESTKQLLVVSSYDFNTTKASLQAYEKREGSWAKVFTPFSVNLGRSGLAWGKGLYPFRHAADEPIKQEGDGKSPAGLFTLESFFGYEDRNFKLPYLQVGPSTLCIDDSASPSYNSILQSQDPTKYKSFEYMKRKDDLYKLGIVVAHNPEAIKKGGSCIFIHIQKSEDSPTSGCTAMQERQLLQLMKWLDKVHKPLLLQLPKSYLEQGFN